MMENSGSSWQSKSWDDKKNLDDTGSLKTSEFESEQFFSMPSNSKSNDYCPYSLRQSQLSTAYQYDVLLVYDPEENSYYIEKLMEYLRPQNLKIFDFARDAPPGLPQRKVLQSTLQVCRYTCIMITKKFISNFWLQLRTDMSIQDMLDNEQKMFSVIVVVMDAAVKRVDLPLDLATLSPLFFTERYFENRIKLAFSKIMPFPSLSEVSKRVADLEPPKYNDVPTARFDSRLNPDLFSLPILKEPSPIQMCTRGHHNRLPCEHGDGTFVMPPSILSSSNPTTFDTSLAMQRAMSVTVGSTGSRQPQETFDSYVFNNVKNNRLDSTTKTKNFLDSVSTSENLDSLDVDDSEISQTIEEGDFSFLNQSDQENRSLNEISRPVHDSEVPVSHFQIDEPSFIDTTASELSELEISTSTLPSLSHCETLRLDSPRLDTIVADNNNSIPADDDSCTSLPAQFNSQASSLSVNKKSRSMKSLVSSKLSKMSKTLSLRTKNK